MSVGTKNKFAIAIASESAFNTPRTATASFASALGRCFPVRMERPTINIETATDEDTLIGVYEAGINSIVTKQTMSASVEMDARNDAIALWSKFALGVLTTTGASAPYTHTATVGTADLPSLTAYFQDAFVSNTSTKAHEYRGVKVQRMTIRGDAGGKVTMSIDLMGSGVHTLDATITSFPSVSTEGILGTARVTTFSLDGGTTNLKDKLKSFEFIFENQFDDAAEMVAGQKTLPSMERIGFTVTGSFTFKADAASTATDLITDILGGNTDESVAKHIRIIIAGVEDATHTTTINVYSAILDDTSLTGQRAKVEKPITFKGLFSQSQAKACDIAVLNANAGTVYDDTP